MTAAIASVCPVAALKEYISRTEVLRSKNGTFESKLFLSFIKPNKPVSTATIARWIKSVLDSAGVDTSILKAHSVRGAATTHAYVTGVPVSQILKMADWSSKRTFCKHYLRVPEESV